MAKTKLEIMFYPDGSGYYNHAGASFDFDNLADLKKKLKEKFAFDFVKLKATHQYTWREKACYHVEF